MKAKLIPMMLLLLASILVFGGLAHAAPVSQQGDATATPAMQPTPSGPAQAPISPRQLTALVGAGQDTTAILTFAPQHLRVRVGDTVTWKFNSTEIHTVSFVNGVKPQMGVMMPLGGPSDLIPALAIPKPNGGPADLAVNPQVAFPTRAQGAPVETHTGTGFYSSGIMSSQPAVPGAPPNDTFQLTFAKPGVYNYVCLVHPDVMHGTVEVVDSTVTDVPSQSDVDTQAQAEITGLTQLIDQAKAEGKDARKEPGPSGTNILLVRAGGYDFVTADARAQVLEFMPKDVTIKVGDTVVWGSTLFHTITFDPGTPQDFITANPQPNGPPELVLNPKYAMPAKPSGTYDPTQFYNSGLLGGAAPSGYSWALTFDKPGTYEYYCAVHREEGMKGTIIVQP